MLGITILGAPLGDGAGHPGTVMGPAALRVAGLAGSLRDLGHDVEDLGDVVPEALLDDVGEDGPSARNRAVVARWGRAVSTRVRDVLAEGRVPVLTGGDHSLSMGSVAGAAAHWRAAGREMFVLWLDAHADFNTPETTPSGNLHGMSAALLCGEPGLDGIVEGARGCLAPDRLTVFGARSVDRGERELLARRGVDVVDMRRIDEFGAGALMRGFLARVDAADGVVHVSFDVDFLDPSAAPGVGTAVPGGATYREAHLLMEMLHDSGRVGSVDVVELNPYLDERGRSAVVMVEMVSSLFGRRVVERPAFVAGRPEASVGPSMEGGRRWKRRGCTGRTSRPRRRRCAPPWTAPGSGPRAR